MKRPSKLRVLLAVNRWRLAHGKRPIARLPKGRPMAAFSCPIKKALDVHVVTGGEGVVGLALRIHEGDSLTPLPSVLGDFVIALDAREYPELIA